MEQKIIKIGSSIGVVIPKSLAEKRGYRAGGIINVDTEENSNAIRIEPVIRSAHTTSTAVNPEILSWTNEFIDKNRELLKRLADK